MGCATHRTIPPHTSTGAQTGRTSSEGARGPASVIALKLPPGASVLAIEHRCICAADRGQTPGHRRDRQPDMHITLLPRISPHQEQSRTEITEVFFLPILILAQSLKQRTPEPIPFSRQHYGKSDKIWVGRLVVAEQSIRTPLILQEVWQRGPAPTPLCCSSQPRASNGDFLLDCITDTDATAPLQMACASCMSVPATPSSGTGSPVRQIERVPLNSILSRRPS